MNEKDLGGPAVTVMAVDWAKAQKDSFEIDRLRRWMEENARPALQDEKGDVVEAAIKMMGASRELVQAMWPSVQSLLATAHAALAKANLIPVSWTEPAEGEGEAKKTPAEWMAEDDFRILDPDGWRGKNGRSFADCITWKEYVGRRQMSTVEKKR